MREKPIGVYRTHGLGVPIALAEGGPTRQKEGVHRAVLRPIAMHSEHVLLLVRNPLLICIPVLCVVLPDPTEVLSQFRGLRKTQRFALVLRVHHCQLVQDSLLVREHQPAGLGKDLQRWDAVCVASLRVAEIVALGEVCLRKYLHWRRWVLVANQSLEL